MIESVEPMISLPATDIERAMRFYTDALGLRVVYRSPRGSFYMFGARDGSTVISVHSHPGPLPEPDPDALWVFLRVADIGAARETLEARGVRFLGETEYMGPGHWAPLVDSEGNVLRLYEPLREVRRSITINAPPERVFRALTDARAIAAWFTALRQVELDPQPGGRISFVDPLYGEVEGQIVALERNRRIAFRFARNWPEHLEVTIRAQGAATLVEVRQTGFDAIRDRDFNLGRFVANLDQALTALTEQAATPG